MPNTSLPGWYFYGKIEKAAEALRRREPGLTKEQAVVRVWEQRPDLREAYSDEIRKDISGR